MIDLDPYGSVVPFLDAAVSAVRDGGLLCITCTDTRVLCGPDLAKCFYYYGSVRSRVHDFNEVVLLLLRMPFGFSYLLSVQLPDAIAAISSPC